MRKILCLALVVVLAFGLVGCGSGESAEQAVGNALDAIKSMDKEGIEKYIDYDELVEAEKSDEEADLESEEMIKLVFEKLEYNIVSSEKNGDTALVTTEITNINMAKVFGEFIMEAFSLAFSDIEEEEMNSKMMEIFTNLINREDNEMVTITVDINLKKINDEWKIDMSDELSNAIFGGMVEAMDSLSND